MQTFKQFLAEAANQQDADMKAFCEYVEEVTDDSYVLGTVWDSGVSYNAKKNTVEIKIAKEGDEDNINVEGKIVFTSPTECVLDIEEWTAAGRVDDFEDKEVFDAEFEKLKKQGVKCLVDEDDFFVVWADVSKLRNRKLKFNAKEDLEELVEVFEEARENGTMWEDGDVEEMIHAIDLSALVKFCDAHRG